MFCFGFGFTKGFNNMMHAMYEYGAKLWIIINGKHLLASWGKKKEKHVGGEKEKKKRDRAFARPCVELSSFMLSN